MPSTGRPRSCSSRRRTASLPLSSALLTQTISGLSLIPRRWKTRLGRLAGFGVQFQLAADGVVVRDRVAAVGGHRLDEVDQHARPLDVAQELVTEADAAVRPSIRPGRSASMKARSPPIMTRPRFGCLVVNG